MDLLIHFPQHPKTEGTRFREDMQALAAEAWSLSFLTWPGEYKHLPDGSGECLEPTGEQKGPAPSLVATWAPRGGPHPLRESEQRRQQRGAELKQDIRRVRRGPLRVRSLRRFWRQGRKQVRAREEAQCGR